MENWDGIVESLRPRMESLHKVREAALQQSRLLIQTCSKCIRHVHRNQFPEAEALLEEARGLARRARSDAGEYPEILYHGYLQDAEKEMVEAAAVLAIVQGKPLPSPSELGVQTASYLNGMGEAASECRRYLLDELRKGNHEQASRMLATMEMIYDDLISFDYPDSLTGGLRRTCDALRAVIERTRSDLTMTLTQMDLLAALERTRADLGHSS